MMRKPAALIVAGLIAAGLTGCTKDSGPRIPVKVEMIKITGNPHSMSFGRNQMQLFTSCFTDNSIIDIDLKEKKAAGRYPVLDGPGYLIRDGAVNRLYGLHHKKNGFAIMQMSPTKLLRTRQTGQISLAGGAVRPGYDEIWVTNGQTKVLVFTRRFALKQNITMGRFPQHLAFTRGGKQAVVTLKGENAIGVVDGESYKEIRRINVGIYPRDIVVTGNKACVSNYGSNDISIVDLVKGKEIARIPVNKRPHALSYKKGTLWVACEKSLRLVAIDVSKEKIIGTIRTGFFPGDILARDNGTIIAAARRKKAIAIITPLTDKK